MIIFSALKQIFSRYWSNERDSYAQKFYLFRVSQWMSQNSILPLQKCPIGRQESFTALEKNKKNILYDEMTE